MNGSNITGSLFLLLLALAVLWLAVTGGLSRFADAFSVLAGKAVAVAPASGPPASAAGGTQTSSTAASGVPTLQALSALSQVPTLGGVDA